MRLLIVLFGLILFATDLSAQKEPVNHENDTLPDSFYLLQKVERNGVTMPEIEIKEVTVVAVPGPSRRADYRRYERLIRNIKRVYPYAMMVRIKLADVNSELQKISGDRARREYLKNIEKDVFAEYEDDMRSMTITQGRLLIKLIDRETQNTSYALIREYRGGLSAIFWQSIARIFGTNLKDTYDPFGEDALIELIIREVDEGRL